MLTALSLISIYTDLKSRRWALTDVKKEHSIQLSAIPAEFAEAIRAASETGVAAIADGGDVRYLIVDVEKNPVFTLTEEEKLEITSKRIMKEHRKAFEELAK